MGEESSEGASSSSSSTETMTAKITRLTNKATYPDWDVGLAAMLIVRKLHKELDKDPADADEEKSKLIYGLIGQTIGGEATAVFRDEVTKYDGVGAYKKLVERFGSTRTLQIGRELKGAMLNKQKLRPEDKMDAYLPVKCTAFKNIEEA